MKKILITGGSGFIGTNFINYLSKKKIHILNIDKLSSISTKEKFKKIYFKKNYTFIKYDLKNQSSIYSVLKKYNPHYIINFAAESHVDRSITDPIYFIKNNIMTSTNLFYAFSMMNNKNKIKFFHISTDEVYGSIKKGSFKEKNSYNPSSPYSASKGSADLIAESFNKTYNTNIKILNLTNNYGPYQFPEKFIPTLIFHFLKNKAAPLYGNGKNFREWMHVSDSCEAIWKIMKLNKKFDRMNIGTEKRYSNIEILKIVFNLMKSKNLTKLSNSNYLKKVKDRPGHDLRYALNSKLFKNYTKYKMKINLVSGLNQTINWYIENKNWLKEIKKKYHYKRLGLYD